VTDAAPEPGPDKLPDVPRGIPVQRTFAPPPRRGGPGLAIVILGVALVGGCMLFGLLASIGGAAGGGLGGAHARLIEETVTTGTSDAKVALVEVEGVIAAMQGGGMFGGGVNLVERVKKELDQAAGDANVKALLLSIDSPGGTVTASDQIWKMVKDFKAKTNKPVVIHMGALCASGGYYIAVAGDEIVCEPTTITGSIGVILSGLNFHELLKKYGVADVSITSGPNKDLLNSTAPIRESHLAILQSMVDEAYDLFTDRVAQGRKLPIEEVKKIADGRIYTAKQALEKKLVDHIDYRDKAFERAQALASVSGAKLVKYNRQPTLADVLSGNVRAPALPSGELKLDASVLDELTTPRLLALWRGR
jgi:protease IV